MSAIQLAAAEQRQLEQTLHDTHNVRLYQRTLAVLKYSHGRSVKNIARTLGMTRQNIHNWVVRFQHDGSSRAV